MENTKSKKDYSRGKIYCIRNDLNDMIYIGSTCQTLAQRMTQHRKAINCKGKVHYKLYEAMLNYGRDHFYIELIEDCNCERSEQLLKREGELIREYKAELNKTIAGRTSEEYYETNIEKINERSKAYREANKDKINKYHKEHYEANKEIINEKAKNYREANKEALLEQKREYYKTNKNNIIEKGKEYYEANKDKIANSKKEFYEQNKTRMKEHNKKYYEANKDKIKARRKELQELKKEK